MEKRKYRQLADSRPCTSAAPHSEPEAEGLCTQGAWTIWEQTAMTEPHSSEGEGWRWLRR